MEDRQNVQGQNGFQCLFVDVLWYVVFEEKPHHIFRWWDIFTRRGFRHCWAYTRSACNTGWMALDPASGGLQLGFYPDAALEKYGYNDLHQFVLSQGFKILPTNALVGQSYLPRLMPATCVEVVRLALGIDNRYIFTPFQLYKYIVKNSLNMFEYKRILESKEA